MAAKVYILISGPVYENRVAGAYSTRAAAEEALRSGDEDTALHEFELDAPLPLAPADHSFWHVHDEGHKAIRLEAFGQVDIGQVAFDGYTYWLNLWAKDQDHAMRMGAEKIEQFKALSGTTA